MATKRIKRAAASSGRLFWRNMAEVLTAGATSVLGAFLAFPEAMIGVWNMIPPDMKMHIPQEYAPYIPVAVMIVGTFASVFKRMSKKEES